jgi:hypothetical protein
MPLSSDNDNVQWTAKAPALLFGIAALVISFVGARFGYRWVAAAFAVLALVFFAWSFAIKDWCVANEQSAFSSAFHQSFRGCLRQKGWLEF